MIYRLEDGDCVKILPLLNKDGSFLPIKELRSFFIGNKTIFDTSGNLAKAIRKKDEKAFSPTKYMVCIYHNDEIKFTMVGSVLFNIILENYKFDPRNNLHLKINIKNCNLGGMILPDYKDSLITDTEWNKPDFGNNQDDWISWIKNKQPFYYEDYINSKGLIANLDLLKKEGYGEFLQEVISENRDKKINQILTKT